MRSSIRHCRRHGLAPLVRCLAIVAMLNEGAGCYRGGQRAPTLQKRTGEGDQPAVTSPELVSLTETLADTYAITIAQAVNQIQENSSAEVRKQAQHLKTFVGTTAYYLAASPNPEVAMVDLTVNISLQRSLFAEGAADRWFGSRAPPLVDAYMAIDAAAWSTLARVYTAQQIAVLRDAIIRYREENKHQTTLQFVRLPALGKYRDVSLVDRPGSVRLMSPVAEASKTAMELRLLGERSLFIAQRFPYIINWHSEQVLYDSLATPEAQGMIKGAATFASSAQRLADMLEQLPHTDAMTQTLAELNATLAEAVPLLGAMRGVIGEWNETLRAADSLMAPFQARGVGGGPTDRAFEVSRYAAALEELGSAARELNLLLVNTSRLVESPALGERLREMQGATEAGLGRFAELGDRFIDRIFVRGLALLGTFFGALLAYRVAITWIVRRLSQGPRP